MLFKPTSKPDPTIFDGPSGMDDLLMQLVKTNQEPGVFCTTLLNNLGVSARSGVAIELTIHLWSLWSLAVIDGVDLKKSVTAEHISRRALQQKKALRRNAKTPDYDTLDAYMIHCVDPSGAGRMGGLDRHIASVRKDEAVVLKGERLAREEAAAVVKTKG